MARRIAISNLNASTKDILNTIRANASMEYQNLVPVVSQEKDIPAVGEVICGYPAFANQFLSSLVNRIAFVKVRSAVFNNAYAMLKKGYLEFGETVEEVFVNIAKAREFSSEKAESRELKRTIPDVRSAFHAINWKVQYPVTIENDELRQAFLSYSGVEDLIAKIVNSVTTGAEYDEYLLFKYLIIKAATKGKMYPVAFDASDMTNAAKSFRGISNSLEFMSKKYNAAGVTTTTKKSEQYIFMSAEFNAAYDVDVLASAFNMDKATFMGHLKLIDDFTTFDNDRFDVIRENSTYLEEVTSAELALMADVKAVLVDEEWFQIYDNLTQFSEKFVASGLYWNYFYNVWKTVSSSPFSNAGMFVNDEASVTNAVSYDFVVSDKSVGDSTTILTLVPDTGEFDSLAPSAYRFIQNEDCTEAGIAVHRYGAILIPNSESGEILTLEINGTEYSSSASTTVEGVTTVTASIVAPSVEVGDKITFTKTSELDT